MRWVATPESLRNVAGWSKLPANAQIPCCCKSAMRDSLLVKAYTRVPFFNKAAARIPTSPQPTINTRGRLKRDGNAPRGFWFEGKIQSFVVL